ncbi:MAG: PKD domain-containing protein [Cyclobacteriaceae bacterium]
MRFLLIGLCFFIATPSLAQSVVADFVVPASACLNETIKIKNQSVNAVKYEWDFCQGDLSSLPTAKNLGGAIVTSNSPGIKVVTDGTNWFGFVADKANSGILRLDFGTSIDNPSPITTNLGSIGSTIISPIAIDVVFSNGNWYGFVLGDYTSVITRIDFGASLTTPSNLLAATVLLTDSPQASYGDIQVVPDEGQWYIIYTRVFSVNVVKLATIISIPSAGDLVTTGDISSSFNYLSQIKLIKQNGNWYGYVISIFNGKFFKLVFGTNLFVTPVYSDITSAWMGTSLPTSLGIGLDGDTYQAIIGSTLGLARVTLGKDLSSTAIPSGVFLGNLPDLIQTYKMGMVKDHGVWRYFACATFNSNLYRVTFPDLNCGNLSSDLVDPMVSYDNAGSNGISLRAYSDPINYIELSKTVTISTLPAPSINFRHVNSCVTSIIGFTYQSPQAINTFNWNFGDSNSSASPNPFHQYALAGKYLTELNVIASNGCGNYVGDTVKIYNAPIPSFTLPSGLICTNQNYQFTNTSTFDVGSSPIWQWNVNGANAAITTNLNYVIPTANSQAITLAATIQGCTAQVSKNLPSIQIGPLVGFNSFATGCLGSLSTFTNTTTGTVTTYSWNFGDGNTSPSTNTSNVYTNIGPYSVTLQANNAAGCQNSLTKQITIYSKPQPDFSIGLPPFSCSGSSSQFTDLTPSPTDSNIASYAWSFGDAANGTSIFKNPTYTYSTANSYNVSMSVTTNFGCTNSIQKSVTIAQSPLASFTNLPACVNQATQFTDASTGNIKSRLWQIQGSTFITPNPPFTFPASGTFPVVLTVTGNNNCVAQVNKSINVPIPPSLDFSVQAPCANMNTIFTEITNATDPSISQAWAFGSQANGSGSPAQYSFSTPSNYSVRLSSTRQSGCVYSLSKNISIVNAPVADFLPSVDAGAAPLSVSFTNNSTFANSYQWKFGDKNNSTSLQVSPSFVFSDLGNFNVELAVSNTVGCTNKSIKIISVVVPRIDMIMSDFFFTKDNVNALQPVVTVVNKSNVSVTDPIILVDVAGGSSVKKKIIGTLKPNQELTQVLDFQIVPESIGYICAEVEVTGDTDLFQNRKCISLQGGEIIFTPFPNPAQAELNLDWINVEGGTVSFQIFNSKGSLCLEQSFSNLVQGINRLTVNTSSLSPGVYVIRFSDSKITQSHRFAIVGN